MKVEKYLELIGKGEIPPEHPNHTSIWGHSWPDFSSDYHQARDFCIVRGLWTVITTEWTSKLADWIGERSCLEVMAGGGWIAKALTDFKVDIIATDNFGWGFRHTKLSPVYPVEEMDAVESVKHYKDKEVLIVSWPPYGDETIVKVCDEWGNEKPIIYIGESDGGCNAPEEFFQRFEYIDDEPEFPLFSWPGIHDQIMIGTFSKGENDG